MSEGRTGSGSTEEPLDPEARLALLEEALASYASDPDDPPVEPRDRLQAAVALVLRPPASTVRADGSGTGLLLIRRAEHPGDPWSGHMALPGGRRDRDDPDLRSTAVRETAEETGIRLDDVGRLLGILPTVTPRSVRLPRMSIHPFVFAVPTGMEARVASPEVAAVHWVPVEDVAAPENYGATRIELPGGARDFPCIRVVGEVVWGLTHRILEDFLELYPGRGRA